MGIDCRSQVEYILRTKGTGKNKTKQSKTKTQNKTSNVSSNYIVAIVILRVSYVFCEVKQMSNYVGVENQNLGYERRCRYKIDKIKEKPCSHELEFAAETLV